MELVFKKLKRQDTYGFAKWGKHDDPRFFHYNFPFRYKAEYDAWYFSKQKLFRKKVFGLFSNGDPVGFITLKHINYLKGRAELGVAVDPNHLSEGYGSEMIRRFLSYVFTHYPIHTMRLKVAHFNLRAQKSYEKVGFVKINEVREPFEEQSYKDLIYSTYPDQFDLDDDILYTTFYVMEIKKHP